MILHHQCNVHRFLFGTKSGKIPCDLQKDCQVDQNYAEGGGGHDMRNKLRAAEGYVSETNYFEIGGMDCHEMEVEDRLYNLSFTIFLFKHISTDSVNM